MVAEFGVPLRRHCQQTEVVEALENWTHGISDGVSGLEGGSNSIEVGGAARDILATQGGAVINRTPRALFNLNKIDRGSAR